MKTTNITSASNPRVKLYASLEDARARREHSIFLAEGPRVLDAARTANAHAIALLLDSSRFKMVPDFAPQADEAVFLSEQAFAKISAVDTGQGIAAVFNIPQNAHPAIYAARCHLLVAFGIQDPGNMGALMRVAAGAGFDALIAVKPSADLYSPKTVRASVGTIFSVPVSTMEEAEFESFIERNAIVPLATASNGASYLSYSYPDKLALLIGSEGDGLPNKWISKGTCLSIPMARGVESLNAAVAAGVLAFDIMHRGKP